MSENTQNENMKQAKRIVGRWRRADVKWTMTYTFFLVIFVLFFCKQIPSPNSLLPTLTFITFIMMFAFLVGHFLSLRLITYLITRKFVQRLTTEEHHILASAVNMSEDFYETYDIRRILEAHQKINPKTEYLRASGEIADDTLLRAVTYSAATPQEELLRAAPIETEAVPTVTPERPASDTEPDTEETSVIT